MGPNIFLKKLVLTLVLSNTYSIKNQFLNFDIFTFIFALRSSVKFEIFTYMVTKIESDLIIDKLDVN
jgi:hypothetical protein